MKVREVMTDHVVRIHPEESVAVAARTLAQFNIGALPVCGSDGKLCGVVTDRDIVTRCLAANRSTQETKVREIMTGKVIPIHPEETVEVAARKLAHYNVGVLPVCENDGALCGIVTDRDLVTRCVAANRSPANTTVRQVMTGRVISVRGDMEVSAAAHLMGREQIRRLPITENGRLCGMLSLGDLAAREEKVMDAADALNEISRNLTEK